MLRRGAAVTPVKILHVIPSVGPWRGGPSFVIQAMTKGLAARGWDVHVATTDDNGPERLAVLFGCAVPKDSVTYWYFPRQTRFYLFSWPFFRWLARHVADYDLVHIHTLFSFAVIPAAYWAHRYGVPYVVRPLGTLNRWGIRNRRRLVKRISLLLIDRHVLSGAAAVHYTSEQEREEAAEVVAVRRAEVIPNPVDFRLDRATILRESFESRHPELAGKKRILFLSRLDPKKGIDLLLAAFARLRIQLADVVLILGGTGEEAFMRRLRELARDLGIEAGIVWTGFLEGDQKKAALAGADVFVLPSYSENFGIAAVEAMAAGLPVVVSDQVGIHREIAGAGAGLVVPCDIEKLANALLQLFGDAPLRTEMARRGERLAESFSSARVSDRLIDLYMDITHASFERSAFSHL